MSCDVNQNANIDLLESVLHCEFARIRFLAGIMQTAAKAGRIDDVAVAHGRLLHLITETRRCVSDLPETYRDRNERLLTAIEVEVKI
jgi:hypothetical protein